MKKIVLFHRDFQRFTGGHLKVWNYFNHVLTSKSYEPRIAFTANSTWDQTNPWVGSTEYVTDWQPETADVLFLAGADWKSLSANGQKFEKPIINLIQHPRHADPRDELYNFLSNRAIRICVSEQVADAIKSTGIVNGQVFVIPNDIALDDIPARMHDDEREIDLLICGVKAPDLARQVAERLSQQRNLAVTSLLDWMPRAEYLERLNNAKVAVTLPRESEGFYLPALEAMACGAIVVCPDCVGNRDFCRDRLNCFRPGYDADELVAAIQRALGLMPEEADKMRKQAETTVKEHSLERERESFLEILERVDELWRE